MNSDQHDSTESESSNGYDPRHRGSKKLRQKQSKRRSPPSFPEPVADAKGAGQMTWAEAAESVLSQFNHPIPQKEILRLIHKENLKSVGRGSSAPLAVLNSMLNANSKGPDALFYRQSPGSACFGLVRTRSTQPLPQGMVSGAVSSANHDPQSTDDEEIEDESEQEDEEVMEAVDTGPLLSKERNAGPSGVASRDADAVLKCERVLPDKPVKRPQGHFPAALQSARNLKPPSVVPLNPPKLSPSSSSRGKQPLIPPGASPPSASSASPGGSTLAFRSSSLSALSRANYERLKQQPPPRRMGPTTSALAKPAPPFMRPPGAALRVMPPKKRVKLEDDDDDESREADAVRAKETREVRGSGETPKKEVPAEPARKGNDRSRLAAPPPMRVSAARAAASFSRPSLLRPGTTSSVKAVMSKPASPRPGAAAGAKASLKHSASMPTLKVQQPKLPRSSSVQQLVAQVPKQQGLGRAQALQVRKQQGPGRPQALQVAKQQGPGRPQALQVAKHQSPGRPQALQVAKQQGPGRPQANQQVPKQRGPGRPQALQQVPKQQGPGRPQVVQPEEKRVQVKAAALLPSGVEEPKEDKFKNPSFLEVRFKRLKKVSVADQIKRSREGKVDLMTPDSIVASCNIKDLINLQTFGYLPPAYQYQLLMLLPKVDRIAGADGALRLSPLALSNEFFSRACLEYKDRLLDGEFNADIIARARLEEDKKLRLDPWKTEFFEPVYGKSSLEDPVASQQEARNPPWQSRESVVQEQQAALQPRESALKPRESALKPRESAWVPFLKFVGNHTKDFHEALSRIRIDAQRSADANKQQAESAKTEIASRKPSPGVSSPNSPLLAKSSALCPPTRSPAGLKNKSGAKSEPAGKEKSRRALKRAQLLQRKKAFEKQLKEAKTRMFDELRQNKLLRSGLLITPGPECHAGGAGRAPLDNALCGVGDDPNCPHLQSDGDEAMPLAHLKVESRSFKGTAAGDLSSVGDDRLASAATTKARILMNPVSSQTGRLSALDATLSDHRVMPQTMMPTVHVSRVQDDSTGVVHVVTATTTILSTTASHEKISSTTNPRSSGFVLNGNEPSVVVTSCLERPDSSSGDWLLFQDRETGSVAASGPSASRADPTDHMISSRRSVRTSKKLPSKRRAVQSAKTSSGSRILQGPSAFGSEAEDSSCFCNLRPMVMCRRCQSLLHGECVNAEKLCLLCTAS